MLQTWEKIYTGVYFALIPLVLISFFGAIGGMFSEYHWLLDLSSHLYLQYLLIFILGLFVFLSLHKYILCALDAAGILLTVLQVHPAYISQTPLNHQDIQLRVITMNVNIYNPKPKKLARYLQNFEPDILVLQEAENPKLRRMLNEHFAIRYPETGTHENVLYSNFPFSDIRIMRKNETTFLKATTENGNSDSKPFSLYAIHAASPTTPADFRNRNRQLNGFSKYLSRQDERQVVVGDFNTTPWSFHFKRFLQTAKLKDSRNGFGIQPTWPTYLPTSMLQIPIDHCLISPDFQVQNRVVGHGIGSDHRPVIVDLAVNDRQ